ncbi:MAG: InlB B-repeat-containing protein, partial [Erysipelotrichaceae bacterium]|nr:InlB B-repeat-containing protein [Erysipelotrichaceae bacterium]
KEFTITYLVDGETYKEYTAAYDTETPVPADPTSTDTNYTFKAWTPEVAEKVTGDATYTATWKGIIKRVVYSDGMGDILASYDVEYGSDTPAYTGTLPTREGYRLDEENLWTPAVEDTVTKNIVYSLNWIKQLTVTFDPNNGDAATSLTVDEGSKLTKPTPDPELEGHSFLGWFDGNNQFDFDNDTVTEDLTLKAKYDIDTFTVTYVVDGETYETETVEYGEKATKPADPEKEGCTFAGWYDGENEYDFDTEVKDDLTLTAKFSTNEYTVTFDADGGTPEPEAQTVKHGEKAVKPETDPAKEGYTFLGWYDGANEYDFDTEVKDDLTLTAKYEVIKLTVTFVVDGETYDTQTVEYGQKAEEPEAPEKEGYAFAGWYDGEDEYDFDTEVKEDLTLTAKWTVVYGIDMPESLTVVAESSVDLEAKVVSEEPTDKVIKYESSDPSIATVDENGVVTGVKVGRVVITAYLEDDENISATCNVRVLFKDVTEPIKYYFDPVYWAVDNGVTTGTSPTLFSPDAGCTRGQVVTFLWRLLGSPEPQSTNPFNDVNESNYFYKAVVWASETGVTTGTSPTTFEPNKTCTREQIVTFLWRAAKLSGDPAYTPKDMSFSDVKEGKYFYEAVRWAYSTDITTGVSVDRFGVGDTCIRAMVVTFLKRYNDAYGS